MRYSFVIFDIDGTLIDTEFAVLSSLRDTIFDLKGIRYEDKELKFVLGIPSEEALLKLSIDTSQLLEAYNLWNKKFERYIPQIKLFDGIMPLIEKLHNKGIPLGLLTSKDKIEFEKDFAPLGIIPYFKHIVTAESTSHHKPRPEPMIKILELSGIKAKKALYIGDSIYDMECALSANVDCVLALWGREGIDHIKATYYAESPLELWEILNP